MSNLKGIDVSSYQGNIDFSKVKASGVEIVYIKATQGTGYINPYLSSQYAGAKSNELKIGFYHFLTHDDPAAQAQHFFNIISGMEADCRYVIDVEDQSKWNISDASRITRAFADCLISQGKEPAIYTGDYFYRDTLDNSVKDIPLWVANYGSRVIATNYVGHQYSSSGSVSGVAGNVDMNNFSEGILLNIDNKEEYEVEIIVVYGDKKDRNAAEIIADHYNCSTIFAQRPYNYSKIKRVICVGATPLGRFNNWTSYKTDLIQGADEEDTVIQSLKFVGRL